MPIISKETWEKFDPTEQKEIRELYSSLINVMKLEEVGSQRHIVLSGMQGRYISLFGKENLHPQSLTYEDVARELFKGKDTYYINDLGGIQTITGGRNGDRFLASCNCTSKMQTAKLLAINKLLNVAKFLNKDWKPDWNYVQDKWYLAVEKEKVKVDYHDDGHNSHIVYFRTQQLAEKAIQILGEDTVRLVLSSDW